MYLHCGLGRSPSRDSRFNATSLCQSSRHYPLCMSSWIRQKELTHLNKNCKKGLTRLDDKERKELIRAKKVKEESHIAPPLELVPFVLYRPNKFIPFYNFCPSMLAPFAASMMICSRSCNYTRLHTILTTAQTALSTI
jgi:hypothetical protein